jgi:TolA-binding protein
MSEAEWDEADLDALLGAAATDLAGDGRARAGDDALIARSIDGAIARTKARGSHRASRRKRSAHAVALVAVVLVAASGAFGWIEHARTARRTPEQTQAPEAMPRQSRASIPATVPPEVARAAEPSSAETAELSSSPSPLAPSVDFTAPELFAQANDTRRRGDATAAARQYGALQRRFPRSPEASLSHVALGRLYLDRLADPGRALAQFDEYLVGGRDGELAEEALVGRALALQRLGRTGEERSAWRTLLDAFPHSLSADRASARMAELH